MRRPKPEDVEEARSQYLAAALAMTGEFDEKIKELKEERERLEAVQLVARTLGEAEQIKHEAVAFSEGRRREADSLLDEAKAVRLEVEGNRESAQKLVDEATAERKATAEAYSKMERERAAHQRKLEERNLGLEQRERMIAEKEEAAAVAKRNAEDTQRRLEMRLNQLASVA